MSSIDLKIGKKYHVKGFSKAVELHSFRRSDNLAKVVVDGSIETIKIDDILGPIVDGLLVLLGRWIMSFFKK